MPEGTKTGPCLTHGINIENRVQEMQYLGAERMGNVLETFPEVCCCEVVRAALDGDLSDRSLLECVQGKCSE
jgi:hypothetical protein